MGEFDFIRDYLLAGQVADADVLLGIGDDAAIVRPQAGFDLCFSSDMMLVGRHFFADAAPADVAHKLLAVNFSDMAAMGAVPRWVLLSAALPVLDAAWLRPFADSLFVFLRRHQTVLIGGDTTRGDMVFNISIIGQVPSGKALRRDAAQVGDDIWLSGQVGSAAAALRHILGQCTLPPDVFAECETALLRPEPRLALGQALLPFAHAAQDVSDGLLQDLQHILTASGVGAVVEMEAVPVLAALRAALPETAWQDAALCGGDDYELVFTAAPADREKVMQAAQVSGTRVTRIGQITASGGLTVRHNGSVMPVVMGGFDHFRC